MEIPQEVRAGISRPTDRMTIKVVLIKDTQSYCVYKDGDKIGWFAKLDNVIDLLITEFKGETK